jgi:hypothetical protein
MQWKKDLIKLSKNFSSSPPPQHPLLTPPDMLVIHQLHPADQDLYTEGTSLQFQSVHQLHSLKSTGFQSL